MNNGLIESQNLTINRTNIDADLNAGLWDKIKVLLKIRSHAAPITGVKPELAMAIATPATTYVTPFVL